MSDRTDVMEDLKRIGREGCILSRAAHAEMMIMQREIEQLQHLQRGIIEIDGAIDAGDSFLATAMLSELVGSINTSECD